MSLIEFKNVSRIYKVGDHEQKALDNIDLRFEEGKFIVILGPSGAGKSTLLNLLGFPTGVWITSILTKALASEYEMKIIFGWMTFVIPIILVFGVSLFVSWMVSKKNKHINMVEALKVPE